MLRLEESPILPRRLDRHDHPDRQPSRRGQGGRGAAGRPVLHGDACRVCRSVRRADLAAGGHDAPALHLRPGRALPHHQRHRDLCGLPHLQLRDLGGARLAQRLRHAARLGQDRPHRRLLRRHPRRRHPLLQLPRRDHLRHPDLGRDWERLHPDGVHRVVLRDRRRSLRPLCAPQPTALVRALLLR